MKQYQIVNENFCPAPWTSIHVDPSGILTNCCVSKGYLGNVKKSEISELVHGHQNKKIKEIISNGKLPIVCESCKSSETSFRNTMVEKFGDLENTFFDNIDNFQIHYADLRFRNTCNYACIYCGPNLSSLWASELQSINKSDTILHTKLVDYFKENYNTLTEIYLAGGEPLLIKENEIILQELLEKKPDIKITVNTNLSNIQNNKIFETLLKFKNVVWIVSVDDMAERYNYIRWPGNWDSFIENLGYLQDLVKNGLTHTISFAMVYTIVNCRTIFDTIRHLSKLGFTNNKFKVMYVSQKPFLDPRNFEDKIKSELKYYIENEIESIKNYSMGENWKTSLINDFITIIDQLTSDRVVSKNIEHSTVSFLNKLDNQRKTDWKQVFPEVAKQLNTV